MIVSPANADSSAHIYFEEDAYCSGSVASVTGVPPAPVRRAELRYPSRAMAQQRDGYAVVRLSIDKAGFVSEAELLEETRGYGFGSTARTGLTNWIFAPGRAGTYCVRTTFALGGSKAPWDDPAMPRAPKPIDTEPAPYVSEEAIAANIECRVELMVRIDDDGAVPAAGVISEMPAGWRCGQSASEAVRQWRFPPDTAPGRYRMVLSVKN